MLWVTSPQLWCTFPTVVVCLPRNCGATSPQLWGSNWNSNKQQKSLRNKRLSYRAETRIQQRRKKKINLSTFVCPRISRIYTNYMSSILMATCSVARISLIQGMRDFGSRSLAFVKILATEQVAIKKRKAKIRVDLWDSWAKKITRG